MLSRCVQDWSGEWRKDIEDVALAVQDVLYDHLDKMLKDASQQRRTIDEIRGQMSVLLSGKTIEGQVVDVPKFIGGKVANFLEDLANKVKEGDGATWRELASVKREVASLRRMVESLGPHKIIAMKRE